MTEALFREDSYRRDLSAKVLEKHCPPTLVNAVGIEEMLKRIPRNYKKAIVSSWLASHFVYSRGLDADEVDFHEFLTEVRKG